MTNKIQIPKSDKKAFYFNPVIAKLSLSVNLIVILFIVLLTVGYYYGNSFQTEKISELQSNQCYYFDNNHISKYDKVTKTINGKPVTAYVIRLTQAQIDSGCYTMVTSNVRLAYYRGAYQHDKIPIPVYVGPNGQNLERIPQFDVFIKSSK